MVSATQRLIVRRLALQTVHGFLHELDLPACQVSPGFQDGFVSIWQSSVNDCCQGRCANIRSLKLLAHLLTGSC